MNELALPDAMPDLHSVVVTVEEIRLTLGPSEEHWRKASFMGWKELPEAFEAAFGEGEVVTANSLRLRDFVRTMYEEKRRLQKFEEPYTDYMSGETGIGTHVRRTVTVAIRYHGDAHFATPEQTRTSTIESGVRAPSPRTATVSSAAPILPTLLSCLTGLFQKRPVARM